MTELLISITWQAKWQAKRDMWQRFYGYTVGRADGSSVTQILADTEHNRRLFARGVI